LHHLQLIFYSNDHRTRSVQLNQPAGPSSEMQAKKGKIYLWIHNPVDSDHCGN
jgi:hypothetical protein